MCCLYIAYFNIISNIFTNIYIPYICISLDKFIFKASYTLYFVHLLLAQPAIHRKNWNQQSVLVVL